MHHFKTFRGWLRSLLERNRVVNFLMKCSQCHTSVLNVCACGILWFSQELISFERACNYLPTYFRFGEAQMRSRGLSQKWENTGIFQVLTTSRARKCGLGTKLHVHKASLKIWRLALLNLDKKTSGCANQRWYPASSPPVCWGSPSGC